MAFNLNPENASSSKEACINWEIDGSYFNNGGKATLFLSDINQSSNNSFFIKKYRITNNERLKGSHTFTDLPAGKYLAKIIIMYPSPTTPLYESAVIEFSVFDLAAPLFKPDTVSERGIIPGFKNFQISLVPLNNLAMVGGTVTFILFGQLIQESLTTQLSRGAINMIFNYNSENKYTINDSRLENDVEYEISCFYTNAEKCSSELSDSIIVRPTNLPTVVTNLTATYDSVQQTLTINFTEPSNSQGYVALNCRATITSSTGNTTYYISSDNSANLTNTPEPYDPIVFNMNNENLLPNNDEPFTITLAINNEYGYGSESDPIYCIHPNDYCSKAVSNNNLNFTLTEDNDLKIENSGSPYLENTHYTVTYVSKVFECSDAGVILNNDNPVYVFPTQTYPIGINTLPETLQLGTVYKYVLNVYYQKTIYEINGTSTGGKSIEFQPKVLNTCFFNFIPHLMADPLTLTFVPDDKKVTVNWNTLTTLEELNGYKIHHYDYIIGEIPSSVTDYDTLNWTLVNGDKTITEKVFDKDSLDNNLVNGESYTFNIRAVTYSNNNLYGFNDRLSNTPSTVTVKPFGKPKTPITGSTKPEDGKSTLTFKLPDDPYNGGDFLDFQSSVDGGAFQDMNIGENDKDANGKYSKEFILTNEEHTILIRLKTKNKTDATVTKESDTLEFTTTPFPKPLLPTNFHAKPYTDFVNLSWTQPILYQIIEEPVTYEVSYKLSTNDDYITICVSSTEKTISSLVSSESYDFRIRSVVHNVELNEDIYSVEYSAVITAKPFIFLTHPQVTLTTGEEGKKIKLKISPALDNYYNVKFNYFVSIYEKSDINRNRKEASLMSIEGTSEQEFTFTKFNDGIDGNVDPDLIDFDLYVINAYYQILNPDYHTLLAPSGEVYYDSSTYTNQKYPFDPTKEPVLTATANMGDNSVTLDWTIDNINVYPKNRITGYQLSIDNVNWNLIPSTYEQDSKIFTTISSLQYDTLYYYYVRAVIDATIVDGAISDNGEAKYSAASNMVTTSPYKKPSAPTLSLSMESEKIVATWTSGDKGYLTKFNYQTKFSYKDVNNADVLVNDWTNVSTPEQDAFSKTFLGLTNGREYTVYIRVLGKVVNENDKLIEGIYAESSILVYNKASAPADFVTKSYPLTAEGHVELTWGTSDLGGLVFDRYEVTPNKDHNNTYNITELNTKIKDLDYTTDSLFQSTPGVGGNDNTDNSKTYNGRQMRIGKKWWNFAVRVVTKTPTGLEVFGDWSFSLNAACKKPTKPTEMSVAKTLYYPNNSPKVEFLSTPGILYMTMPLSWNNNDGANLWEGIGADEDYRYAYKVSSDNGVTWVSPSRKATNTSFPSDGINGLHVWGASDQNLTPTTEGEVMLYTFTKDNSILVGTEYNFLIKRVGYNLFNPANLDGSRTHVESDASDIVLNTSFEVTPQEHLYDPLDTVYYAKPLLGVTSTPSDKEITLNWTAADASLLRGLTLDHYEVQLNEASWVTVDKNTVQYTFSQFNGQPLVNGTTYTLSVRTVCKHTEKDISGTIITKTFNGTPVSVPNIPYVKAAAPTIKAITPLSYPESEKIEIEWDPLDLSNMGGLTVTKYQVRYVKYNTSTNTVNGTINYTYTINTTSDWSDVAENAYKKSYDGLDNGTKYSVEVRAITQHAYLGEIDGNIAIKDNIIPRGKPRAPTIVDSPVEGNGELGLTWNYNISSETTGLLSFDTFKRVSIGSDGSIVTETQENYSTSGSNFSYTFPNLTNGIKYNLNIVPVLIIRSIPETIEGTPLITKAVPHKPASAPTNLRTTPGDKNIVLQWDAVPEASLGGLTLQRYEVRNNNLYTNPEAGWIPTGTTLSYPFSALDNGTTYNMSVRAVTEFMDPETDPTKKYSFDNIKGLSATTSAIPFVKPGTIPNTVNSPVIAVATNGLLSLSFSNPVNVNNNATQFYEYSIDYTPAGQSLVTGGFQPTTNSNIKDIKYLGKNIFSLNLRAYIINPNDSLIKVYGDVITINNLQNIDITSPENLDATPGDKSVTLTWNSVSNVSYKVYIKAKGGVSVAIDKISVSTNSYKFENLDNGTLYEFGVILVFAGGVESSAATVTETPMSLPSVVPYAETSIEVKKQGDNINLNINSGGSSSVNISVVAYYYTTTTFTTTQGSSTEEVLIEASRIQLSNTFITSPITPTLISIKVQNTSTTDNKYIRNYFDITITNTLGFITKVYKIA